MTLMDLFDLVRSIEETDSSAQRTAVTSVRQALGYADSADDDTLAGDPGDNAR